MTDRAGLIVFVNERAEGLFGISRNVVLGQPYDMLLPERLRGGPPVTSFEHDIVPGFDPPPVVQRLYGLHRDGREFPTEVSRTVVHADGRSFVSYIVRDGSERRRAEETLIESARQADLSGYIGVVFTEGGNLDAMLQSSVAAMVEHLDAALACVWTASGPDDGQLTLRVTAGPLADAATGLKTRVPMAQFVVSVSELIDPGWAARHGIIDFVAHPLTVREHMTGAIAVFVQRPVSPALVNVLAGVARTIALGMERDRIEAARNRLAEILDATPDFVTISVQSRPLYINPAARKALGIGKDEQVPTLLDFRPPGFAAGMRQHIFETAAREGSWRGETSYRSKTRGDIPVSQVSVAHKNATGDVEYLSTISRDISAEHRAADALSAAEGRARQALEELEAAYQTTIEGWARTLDLRDHDTEGHTERVTTLAMRLAEAAGMSASDQTRARYGAILHDIGKIAVPDSILRKAGPLSAEEWAIMRRHPQHALDLLSPIAYLASSLDIPFCHHEHWDGSGYPRGIRGEDIPWAARLFAVADVWDALTSDRPYRAKWSIDRAEAHLREQAGKAFDPKAVELFLQLPREARR